MDEKQVRALLAERIKSEADGNESQWAQSKKISQGYITHVRKGLMAPGNKVLAALGLKKVVTYEHIRKQPTSLKG